MISFLILHSESTLELAIATSDVLLLYIFGVGLQTIWPQNMYRTWICLYYIINILYKLYFNRNKYVDISFSTHDVFSSMKPNSVIVFGSKQVKV